MANSIPAQHAPAATSALPNAAAKPAAASHKQAQPQGATQAHVPVDTVHISKAAQTALKQSAAKKT